MKLEYLPIEKIVRVREFERIEEKTSLPSYEDEFFLSSIITRGLEQPFEVVKQNGFYVLTDGYRRLSSLLELKKVGKLPSTINLNALPVIIKQNISPSISRHLSNIRQDLNPIERAMFVKRLMRDEGLTVTEIARNLGITTRAIHHWLIILRCSDKLKEALIKGKISPWNAKILLLLKPDAQDRVLPKVLRKQICGKNLRKFLKVLPQAYFQSSAKKRISKLVPKRGEPVPTIRKIRQQLGTALSSKIREQRILESTLLRFTEAIRQLSSQLTLAQRQPAIKDYIDKKHPDIAKNLDMVLKVVLG